MMLTSLIFLCLSKFFVTVTKCLRKFYLVHGLRGFYPLLYFFNAILMSKKRKRSKERRRRRKRRTQNSNLFHLDQGMSPGNLLSLTRIHFLKIPQVQIPIVPQAVTNNPKANSIQ